ncbi:MAG: adenylate/guanylate cyclase domain-containing protein, partial [Actinomycetota bacterium]|nr:adenylate/guanylate cyclase domain-containing protein [Actinomycetota bacterium]
MSQTPFPAPTPAGQVQTATVLFTDMVSSTLLRARLGDEVADVVFAEHDRLLDEAVKTAGGRLVKHMGDGVLAVFSSAAEALDAAALIQRRVARHNARAASHAFALRVGVAAGDVVLGDGDVSGTPVVEAFRLCAGAKGEQVLLSDVVRALVGSRSSYPTECLGELALRGLPAPLVVHALDWSTAGDAHGVDVPPVLSRARSTAYVGRRVLLDGLRIQLARAIAGESGSALLAGEPGIGKTRTSAELARLGADAGMVVLYGRCDEGLGAPYQPFVEALERYVRTSARPVLGRLARELVR